MAPPRKAPRLFVVLDTNALRAQTTDEVVTPALATLVSKHSNHGDLDVHWIVPKIVRDEREHQLRMGFREILKPLLKAKSLLSLDIELTDESLHRAIANKIDEKLNELKVTVASFDHRLVDWEAVSKNAAFRMPPFEPGDKEKGFKDALVCETFLQLSSNVSGKDSIVLVSRDGTLTKAVTERDARARVLKDLTEVDEEIALRVANVDDKMQSAIEQKAHKFLLEGDKAFWTKANLTDVVWGEYVKVMGSQTLGRAAHSAEPTRLAVKSGNRVTLSTIYTVHPVSRHWIPSPPGEVGTAATPAGTAGLLGLVGAGKFIDEPLEPFTAQIRWSATFTRRRTLTHAKLEDIQLSVAAQLSPNALGNALMRHSKA